MNEFPCQSMRKKDHIWNDLIWASPEAKWGLSWLPRLCDNCGSVHPMDAFRLLLTEGWDVYATNNANISSLIPGSVRGLGLEYLQTLTSDEIYKRVPDYPNPEIVIYSHHMSDKQIARIYEIYTYLTPTQ